MGRGGSRKKAESIDTGTTELHRRHRSILEKTKSGTARVRITDGNELDGLLWKDRISPEEHSILTGFQIDAHRAGLIGPRAQTLEARVSGAAHEMTQREAELYLKHGQACTQLKRVNGSHCLSRVLAICLDDKPARAEDIPLLQQACVTLAKFRATWTRPD